MTPTQMFPCEFYKVFKSIYFKEHLQTTGFWLLYFFSKMLVKKIFLNDSSLFQKLQLQFKSLNCLSLQSLSLLCYLKMSKSPQWHRQSDDLRRHFERSAHPVNDHLAIFNIFQKFSENGSCIQVLHLLN